jgi:hypothetical protein
VVNNAEKGIQILNQDGIIISIPILKKTIGQKKKRKFSLRNIWSLGINGPRLRNIFQEGRAI